MEKTGMNSNKRDIDTYREAKIKSMNQKELIVFLYESSLELMEQAKEKIEANDVPGTHEKLDRARRIFIHLLGTLNLEAGGELAQKLSALYAFFIEKVTMANVTKNIQELDDIIPLVAGIKDSWAAIPYEGDIPVPDARPMEAARAISVEA
jgi:flagellar secretion chaperone FliS